MSDYAPSGPQINKVEGKEEENLAELVPGIKALLSENVGNVNSEFNSIEFQVSDPRQPDLDAIHSGEYEVREIAITPNKEGKHEKTVHFYVGSTEFHLTGKAADKVLDSVTSPDSVE